MQSQNHKWMNILRQMVLLLLDIICKQTYNHQKGFNSLWFDTKYSYFMTNKLIMFVTRVSSNHTADWVIVCDNYILNLWIKTKQPYFVTNWFIICDKFGEWHVSIILAIVSPCNMVQILCGLTSSLLVSLIISQRSRCI